jgi:hypothetical protein
MFSDFFCIETVCSFDAIRRKKLKVRASDGVIENGTKQILKV